MAFNGRGEKMPTLRSRFSFKQFEEALQKLAHKAAIEAVTNLERGIIIKTFHDRVPSQLSEVSTSKETFRFYLRHASYNIKGDSMKDFDGFDVEEKLYLTSNHCTKISFYSPKYYIENRTYELGVDEVDHKKMDAEKKRRQKKIEAFIENFMSGVKLVPRFSLKEHSNR